MLKQLSNNREKQLDIPYGSKYPIYAGICMIAALLLFILYGYSLNAEYRLLSFGGRLLRGFPLGLFIIFKQPDMLLFLGGFISFFIVSFKRKKKLKLYIIPLCFFIASLLCAFILRYSTIPNLKPCIDLSMSAVWFIPWCLILLLAVILLVIAGIIKNKKVFPVICSFFVIASLWSGFFTNEFLTMDYRLLWFHIPGYDTLWIFIIAWTLIFVSFLLLSLGMKSKGICPKCGAPLTSAGKFCNICGEQLSN